MHLCLSCLWIQRLLSLQVEAQPSMTASVHGSSCTQQHTKDSDAHAEHLAAAYKRRTWPILIIAHRPRGPRSLPLTYPGEEEKGMAHIFLKKKNYRKRPTSRRVYLARKKMKRRLKSMVA